MYEDRIQKAVDLFMSGYNCSQSVVAAFADLYDIPLRQALLMSASFGGGIGRMRLTCGAACGMFMLAGFDTGTTDADDRKGKSANYAVVQQLAERYKSVTGSLVCAELLGLRKAALAAGTPPEAEPRTPDYYAKRPCARMVETAARIFAQYLSEKP